MVLCVDTVYIRTFLDRLSSVKYGNSEIFLEPDQCGFRVLLVTRITWTFVEYRDRNNRNAIVDNWIIVCILML